MKSNLFTVFHQRLKQSLPVFLLRRGWLPSQSVFIIQPGEGGTQRAGQTKLEPGEGWTGGHSWSYRGFPRPKSSACPLVLWFFLHLLSDACWWLWGAHLCLIKGRLDKVPLDKELAGRLDDRKHWAPFHQGFWYEVPMGLHVWGYTDRLLHDRPKRKGQILPGQFCFQMSISIKGKQHGHVSYPSWETFVQRNVQIWSFFWNSSSVLNASQFSSPGEAKVGGWVVSLLQVHPTQLYLHRQSSCSLTYCSHHTAPCACLWVPAYPPHETWDSLGAKIMFFQSPTHTVPGPVLVSHRVCKGSSS